MKVYKTWDEWKANGYYVIKGMKATWLYNETYGKEVAMFHEEQVLPQLKKYPSAKRRDYYYFAQDWDDIEYEYGW